MQMPNNLKKSHEMIERLCKLMDEREQELNKAQDEIKLLKARLEELEGPPASGDTFQPLRQTAASTIRCSELRVLIIDDSKLARLHAKKQLEHLGVTQTTEAESGEAGLKWLKLKSFDLVLLDFEMKGGDGKWVLDNCRKLKNKVPVIMISGVLNKGVIMDCMKAGAMDFLVKPVSQSILLPRMEKALGSSLV